MAAILALVMIRDFLWLHFCRRMSNPFVQESMPHPQGWFPRGIGGISFFCEFSAKFELMAFTQRKPVPIRASHEENFPEWKPV